jgi:hypothetical protein
MRALFPALALAATALIWALPGDRMPNFPDDALRAKREVMWTVARELTRAYRAWERGRFEACMEACERIREIDSGYPVAVVLQEAAKSARTDPAFARTFAPQVEEWAGTTSFDEEAVIPLSQLISVPSRGGWTRGKRRGPPCSLSAEQALTAMMYRKLHWTRVSLDFRKASFEEVLEYVRDYGNLLLILDAEARGPLRPDPPISVSVQDRPLREALAAVCAAEGSGYRFRITGEGVVLLHR